MLRVRDATFIDQAELWVDDIRLSDVVQTTGTAAALDLSVTASNFADIALGLTRRDGNFRQLGEDPSYQTDRALTFSSTVHLERLLPPGLGLSIPFTARYVSTASDPTFLNRTDLRGDALVGIAHAAVHCAQLFDLVATGPVAPPEGWCGGCSTPWG